MTDQDQVIELQPDDTEGHRARVRITDEDGWLKERLGRDPGATRINLRASDDDDVEGHGGGGATVALRAFEGDDDTEGHAIAVHFPSREEADAFRRRLLMTGVLAGTIALGAAGGIGLANMTAQAPADAATSGAAAGAGMEWSQVERPGTATAGDTAPDLKSDKQGPTPR